MKFAEFAAFLTEALGAEASARACALLCQRAAGESVYIPARPGPPVIAPNDTPATVARRYRVSRPTAYRWVNKWRV